MKRIVVLVFISILMFNCGSKKGIARKKATKKPHTERVVMDKTRRDKTENENTNEITETINNNVEITSTEDYLNTFGAIAQEEMRLYGIPASITLAQGILESNSGKGRLAVEANNHFGIKCHEWTGAKIYHDDDVAQECFRKYIDAKYSFRDHSLFLTERKRYAGLFKLKKEDYKGWAKELRAAGYATDKKYPDKLISLIERYQLHKLDEEVLGDTYQKSIFLAETNNTTYTVVKGDTMYSISKRYNLTVSELQKLNGLKDTALSIGQQLQVK